MKDKIVCFILGGAIGSAATFFIVSKKYQKMYEHDVAEVKKVLKNKETEESKEKYRIKDFPPESEKTEVQEKPILRKEDFKSVIEYTNYAKGINAYNEEDDEEERNDLENLEEIIPIPHTEGYIPEVVSPYEFNNAAEDFEPYTFMYFADGVITDDNYDIIEDIEGTIGTDAVNHFGDYPEDPDAVYVKNYEKQAYYEVIKDKRNYADLIR